MEEFKFDLKLESYDIVIKIKSKFDIHKNDKPVIEINNKLQENTYLEDNLKSIRYTKRTHKQTSTSA